ncbi:hypothetical protein A3B02_01205 [Candidatus Roizmanbacteria bacterium RIFCSPLOWO2_01_FULL_42_14]|uniref:Uncharacterized protein n=4 Tax=Candidatus Roizmaniibacteriota TaxID=1752723 RepID=A0A1F7K046_9BACT|nr:MAG: hypothetical protein A3D08_01805 [Candidatus Roizmanbacteria bacterium RIFCSPHIGHO2_02_FULL_43_11]OGK37842.1 MAG: hypothetical protein A3F32_03290 [Candidatus Roizmanbacteria bacterium RIFCSPHIGHO2_12_FULL_42_10]OGK51381.1 MAG: hypothetical protein A3B02_01205 [Candidatus Roizmanbacteria bacterium RIFCSPLOWO2_01_FULL_42_14]OGK61223.1 MAG: hypothetical protein A3I56_03985 [Candidatus Roizmanbacteria bacterium RIFCSPLOWO2_02_FULL_43_10]
MAIQFYDVKNRKKVDVPEGQVKKVKYERSTKNGTMQVRYAVKAEMNGVKLTKFVSKDMWDNLSAPMA